MISTKTSNNIKGLASILIVLHHFYNMSLFDFGDTFNYYISEIGSPCVFLFLILSGYGVYMSYDHNKGKSQYWVKKFKKIYVPFLLVNVLWVMYSFRLQDTTSMIGNIIAFLLMVSNDISLYIDSPMWYMSELCLFYILFFVIFFVTKLDDKLKIFLLFVLACVMHIAWVPGFVKLSQYIRWTSFAFPIGVLWAYCVGKIEGSDNEIAWLQTIKKAVPGLIGIALLFLYRFVRNSIAPTDDTILLRNMIFAFGVIFVFMGISKYWNNEKALMIGQLSYIVYLTHEKILRIVYSFVGKSWFTVWLFILSIIIIYLVSWVINKIVNYLNK